MTRLCFIAAMLLPTMALAGGPRLNVLFIAVDDLRPALGCYGDATAITPNIDRLAKRGLVFDQSHCQQAVCNPSRASLMTGCRPDTTRVWDLVTHFREALPEVVTLPQHFKNHGYHACSIGKIYHGSGKPAKDAISWSEPSLHDVVRDAHLRYANPENVNGSGLKRASIENADVSDSAYIDGVVCDEAVELLAHLQAAETPFFLAVGFRKPHLPFCAPQRYWDLYDRATILLPESDQNPAGAPEFAVRSWNELEGYSDIPENGPLTPEKRRELRHGYYACVSYVDAQIGRLLDRLDELHLMESTVICLWGDHGFHLGEQGLWTKANNYEWSTRAPLIVAVPGQSKPGRRCSALVELVDLYPTLAEVCALPPPAGVEGVSLLPLLENPSRPWKSAVFSQYPRSREGARHKTHGDIMGYAMRNDRYRYVEWREWKTGTVEARELYDHQSDAEEMINLADQPSHADLIQKLGQQLNAGWKAAAPAR